VTPTPLSVAGSILRQSTSGDRDMEFLKNAALKIAAATSALTVAGTAMATAPDYSGITGAVDFSAVATAVITVLGSVALVYVAFKGGKLLLAAIR
jgi:hypothetical protein